jgi:hypothetical protein
MACLHQLMQDEAFAEFVPPHARCRARPAGGRRCLQQLLTAVPNPSSLATNANTNISSSPTFSSFARCSWAPPPVAAPTEGHAEEKNRRRVPRFPACSLMPSFAHYRCPSRSEWCARHGCSEPHACRGPLAQSHAPAWSCVVLACLVLGSWQVVATWSCMLYESGWTIMGPIE